MAAFGLMLSEAPSVLRRAGHSFSWHLVSRVRLFCRDWEYEDFRQSLKAFSLEGIMMAKQYDRLCRLKIRSLQS